MLGGESGAPRIHCLIMIIELINTPANALQIFITRKIIHSAEKTNSRHSSSNYSSPETIASSSIIQKSITIDQIRVQHKADGLFDCDATGYYGSIIHPLVSVHLQVLRLAAYIGAVVSRLMYKTCSFVKT